MAILPLQGLSCSRMTPAHWKTELRNEEMLMVFAEPPAPALSETSPVSGFFHNLSPYVLSPSQLFSFIFSCSPKILKEVIVNGVFLILKSPLICLYHHKQIKLKEDG